MVKDQIERPNESSRARRNAEMRNLLPNTVRKGVQCKRKLK